MTSERLAEVRRRQDRAETVGVSFAIDAVHAAYGDREHLLTHVDHLTADNARLREGIEGLIRSNWWTGEVHVDDLRALLSPGDEP